MYSARFVLHILNIPHFNTFRAHKTPNKGKPGDPHSSRENYPSKSRKIVRGITWVFLLHLLFFSFFFNFLFFLLEKITHLAQEKFLLPNLCTFFFLIFFLSCLFLVGNLKFVKLKNGIQGKFDQVRFFLGIMCCTELSRTFWFSRLVIAPLVCLLLVRKSRSIVYLTDRAIKHVDGNMWRCINDWIALKAHDDLCNLNRPTVANPRVLKMQIYHLLLMFARPLYYTLVTCIDRLHSLGITTSFSDFLFLNHDFIF